MAENVKRKGFRLASLAYFLSLGALSLSLVAYLSINGTFAWFGLNKKVDANGMAITVKKEDDVNISLLSYRRNSSDGSVETSTTPHSLNRYDQVFTSDNVYTPVILKLTLSDGTYSDGETLPLKIHHDQSKDSIIINEQTLTSDSSEYTTSTTTSTDSDHPLSSYISSVISVKAAVYNGSIDLSSVTNFQTMVDFFKNGGTLGDMTYTSSSPDTFVEYTTEGTTTTINSKNETLSISGLEYQNAGSSASQLCTLYIFLDYDQTLIEYYIEQMKNGSSMTMETNYRLFPDIDYISIKKE